MMLQRRLGFVCERVLRTSFFGEERERGLANEKEIK
jgi:hypothetical protein